MKKQIVFQQLKGQDLGAFNTAYAHLALPYAAGGSADQSTLTNVCVTLTPGEALTGTTPQEVAAPAARPQRRGRRSREARCGRWKLWHVQVSRALVTLMPSVPLEYDYNRVSRVCSHVCPSGCMSRHGGIVAGAVPVATVPAVLSFAAVSPAESIPMAGGTMSVDIVSHVEVTVKAPALG